MQRICMYCGLIALSLVGNASLSVLFSYPNSTQEMEKCIIHLKNLNNNNFFFFCEMYICKVTKKCKLMNIK